jgi:hypothetical protein
MPALHVMFCIPAGETFPHQPGFAAYAATEDAFQSAVNTGMALALTGWDVLTNDAVYGACVEDFKKDQARR